MRRRHSRLVLLLIAHAAAFLTPSVAGAQSGSVGEGALDLLLPTGARALGMGQATAAASVGIEAVWWNPALVGRSNTREGGYAFAQSLLSRNDNTLSVLLPVRRVGSVALTTRYIDYGEQEAADVIGPTGLLATRTLIAIATFAAPVGPAAAGVSLKYFHQGFACSGECPNVPDDAAVTSAIDVGASYEVRVGGHVITAGASLVNVGRDLQVKDAPQADPLPRRIQGGVAIVPRLPSLPSDLMVTVAVDGVARLTGEGTPGVRAGAELSWQRRYQLRGGYAIHAASGTGFSLGVGINTGRLQLDLARFLSELGVVSGSPPMFLSLRFRL